MENIIYRKPLLFKEGPGKRDRDEKTGVMRLG